MQASPASNQTRLPRAIVRQSERIAQRLAAQQGDPKDPDPAAPPSEATAAPVEPPPPPPAPPVPPAVEDPRHNDPAYWKQRFKVVEGRLAAREVEHRAEVDGLNQRIVELQNQIQTLQASIPPAPTDLSKFLSQEQIDTLGEEEASAIVATATKAAQQAVDHVVETQVKPLRDERANEQARLVAERKQAFLDALTELVPDFEEIDVLPEFGSWLSQKDPASKVQRQRLLDSYIAESDAASVADLFNAFKQSQQTPQPPMVPNGSASNGDVPVPAGNQGLIGLTGAEIRDFYKRSALGSKARPPVTDQERRQFEARLKLPRR